MSGWIKSHRNLFSSEMYTNLTAKQFTVYMAIMHMVNHKECEWRYKDHVFHLKAGQVITSLNSIRKWCTKDITTRSIRTALTKFEQWGIITSERSGNARLITVVDWEASQSDEKNRQGDPD
jgi:hypothetical protein